MIRPARVLGLLLVALVVAAALPAPPAAAQQYPDRPVTALVGYPAGGLADVVLRALVEQMKKKYPKGLAVVNRPGAGGSIGSSEAVQAKPDGYTFALVPISNLVIQPQVNALPYKTPDDYISVINLVSWYPMLAVKADAPWKTVQEFVAAAKASPGKLRVGTPGEGTSSHLNLEELIRTSGAKLTHVPFAGWAEGSPALLGGHIEAIVAQPGEVKPQVEAKRMRVLCVFQPSRNANFPDAPTCKEAGYEAHNGAQFLLILPKGTPPDAMRFLHDAAKAALEEPAFVNFAKGRVIDVDYRPGDKLKADLWADYRKHTDILKRIGMLK
jgi:tripartite-type tricarboxylate transporter receptor subunit TctC